MITNPRKQFKFRVTIFGIPTLPAFGVQEVDLPDRELEQDEHGAGVTNIKTAGKVNIGNATFNRVMSAAVGAVSGEIWEWSRLCQDEILQTGGDPELYKKIVQIDELANDNQTALDTWYLVGCWPKLINGRQFRAAESGNTVESFELSVDGMTQNLPI